MVKAGPSQFLEHRCIELPFTWEAKAALLVGLLGGCGIKYRLYYVVHKGQLIASKQMNK